MKIKTAYLRGELIKFLCTVYPDGIPEQVIVRSFYEYNEHQVIISSLEYLTEKGYAEKKEIAHPYKERESVRWFKITAKGIDLIEGNIEDDAGVSIS
ncbi:hypothetical protein [Treponema pedis]|uniref:hypothetical protein n=1 Tax=Treponema pedis TaxID=409322 RepID=UPI0003FF2A87